jgi:hypothetical protein
MERSRHGRIPHPRAPRPGRLGADDRDPRRAARDLDELITTTVGPAAARARWIVFRDQLRRHLAAEHAAMWRPARARLTGDPRGQALLEAMDDEHHLIGPLQAAADDAVTMAAPRPVCVRF